MKSRAGRGEGWKERVRPTNEKKKKGREGKENTKWEKWVKGEEIEGQWIRPILEEKEGYGGRRERSEGEEKKGLRRGEKKSLGKEKERAEKRTKK